MNHRLTRRSSPWIPIIGIELLSLGLLCWQAKARNIVPPWATVIVAFGFCCLLISHLVLLMRSFGSMYYVLLRLHLLDIALPCAEQPTLQAASCAERAARIIQSGRQSEHAKSVALTIYMQALNDGFYGLDAHTSSASSKQSLGVDWPWSLLVRVGNIGFKHGSAIRTAFNERRP